MDIWSSNNSDCLTIIVNSGNNSHNSHIQRYSFIFTYQLLRRSHTTCSVCSHQSAANNSVVNPFMPTGAFNICSPRDCVSRHNGGTSGAPLKPLRVDSALRALSSLRGLRGARCLRGLSREIWLWSVLVQVDAIETIYFTYIYVYKYIVQSLMYKYKKNTVANIYTINK